MTKKKSHKQSTKQAQQSGTIAHNKKVLHDYTVIKHFEAGVQLYGFEVKAVRTGKTALRGAHVVVRGGEAFLINASISPYQEENTPQEYDPHRTRKLLLNKKEIAELAEAEDTKGLTVVPIMWYNKKYLKLDIAIARGKKLHDKREQLKERDSKRKIHRTLKMGVN